MDAFREIAADYHKKLLADRLAGEALHARGMRVSNELRYALQDVVGRANLYFREQGSPITLSNPVIPDPVPDSFPIGANTSIWAGILEADKSIKTRFNKLVFEMIDSGQVIYRSDIPKFPAVVFDIDSRSLVEDTIPIVAAYLRAALGI